VRAMLKRGEKRGGEGCGETRGWCSPFREGQGCSGSKCRGVTTGEEGGLQWPSNSAHYGGLRHDLKWGE
jgi:hypothetical protein